MRNSGNNTISDNLFSNIGVGIHSISYFFPSEVYYTPNTTIINNNFINDGFCQIADYLSDYLSMKIENNKINEKPLVYLTNKINYSVTRISVNLY